MLKIFHFALIFASTTVVAQTKPAPTDIDLKANYCVAIVQDSVTSLERVKHDPSKPFKSEDERNFSDALNRGLANAQADLRRLHLYLAPRLKQVEIAPMGAVKLQAEGDIKTAQTEKARCSSQCSAEAPAPNASGASQGPGGRSACLNTCFSAISVATKMKACSPTDWLPK